MSIPIKKPISLFGLVMINVIAVDSLRSLPINAAFGLSLVFFYLVAAVIFFIPTALVSAELATGWPTTGGIYVWVREAFGVRIGFLVIWLQWVYNIVWYPTAMAFIAGTLAYFIDPDLAQHPYYILITSLILFWFATFANSFGMRISGYVNDIGALLGTLAPLLMIIGLGIAWIVQGKSSHIALSWSEFFPNFHESGQFAFLVMVLFSLVGLEMSAVHAEEVSQPEKSYPRALFISVILILATLVLASLAIAVVLPKEKISLITGVLQAFEYFSKSYHMPWMTAVLAAFMMIGSLSSVTAWVIGPSKGLCVAIHDSHLLKSLGQLNKKYVPTVMLCWQAVIFSGLCTLFLLMPTVNSAYWLLSILTAQLALLVYVFLFAAAIRLRYKKPMTKRAFMIPGGNIGIWCVSVLGMIACLGAIIFGFFPPAHMPIGNTMRYEILLVLGILFFCVPPFFILKKYD